MEEEKYKWEDDIAECGYDSPGDFLWFYILGGCGCGSCDDFKDEAWKLFTDIAEDKEDKLDLYEKPEREILAHWLHNKNLTEHGTAIRGSWLTDEGKALYEALKKKPNSDEQNPVKVKVGMI